MMAQTAQDLTIDTPSTPDATPSQRVWGGTLEDLEGGGMLLEADVVAVGSLQFAASQPVPELTAEPLAVSVDEFGQYVVEDIAGGAYGVGETPEAAFRDFFVALDDRLARLRRNRGALHPRLAQQLSALEVLFPGR